MYERRTLISYASDYDMHEGQNDVASLSREQQNKLINLMFEPDGDFRDFIMKLDIRHDEPEGLWWIIVQVKCELERIGLIDDTDDLSSKDRDAIIDYLRGTVFFLRLEEAFPPFEQSAFRTDYDWKELTHARDDDGPLNDKPDLRKQLLSYLAPAPVPEDGMILRIDYKTYVDLYNKGKLESVVDRGLATSVYRLSNTLGSTILPITFTLGLFGFLPAMIFVGFWWGAGLFAMMFVARKILTGCAVEWVRADAMGNPDRFRYYSSRSIVWARMA